MAYLAAVLAAVVVVLIVRQRRRLGAYERLLRAVAEAADAAAAGPGLAQHIHELVVEARETRSEAHAYAAALHHAPAGIAVLTASGVITYMNPAAELILTGTGEHAVLRARVSALGKRVSGAGSVESIEIDLHDPEPRMMTLTGIPVDGGPETESLVLVNFDDLSERRRVDAMRTDFVANASHELKTPLGALSLLAETLIEAKDDEMRTRLALRIQAEATRMANVIGDVLRLAETESLGSVRAREDLDGMVREAVESVETFAVEEGIDLVDGGMTSGMVECDRQQVISAIQNLLLNAITYTAIKDTPGVVTYRSFPDDDMICVQVEDTGIGIPTRYTDRVFERFFRVDPARSRQSGGTGLGLSIVKNVAIAHGGTVSVESTVGEGSRFTMRLPVVALGEGEKT